MDDSDDYLSIRTVYPTAVRAAFAAPRLAALQPLDALLYLIAAVFVALIRVQRKRVLTWT